MSWGPSRAGVVGQHPARASGGGGRGPAGWGAEWPHAEASGFYSQSLVLFLMGRSGAEEWRHWVGIMKSSLRRTAVQGPRPRVGFAALPGLGTQAWDRLSRDAGHSWVSWVSVGGMERLRAKGTGQGSDPRAGELGHDLDLAPKFNPVNFQPSGTCGRCLWGEQAGRREVATARVPEAAQSHLGAPLLLLKWPELSLPLNSLKT